MRDLAWINKSNVEATAREAAHLVNDGDLEGARKIAAYAQYERGVANDLFVNPVFEAAFLAARQEG